MSAFNRPFVVKPLKIARILGCLVSVGILANICVHLIKFKTGQDYLFGLVPMFDANNENNIPTYFY